MQSVALPAAPWGLVADDFNNDGIPDLIVGGSAAFVYYLQGSGSGTFTAATLLSGLLVISQLASGDLNGDGNVDFVGVDAGDGEVDVYLGNGNGTFAAATYPSDNEPSYVSITDMNGDGISDVVASNSYGGVRIYLGVGDGTLGSTFGYMSGDAAASMSCADFNGDGLVDMAVGANHMQSIAILLQTACVN